MTSPARFVRERWARAHALWSKVGPAGAAFCVAVAAALSVGVLAAQGGAPPVPGQALPPPPRRGPAPPAITIDASILARGRGLYADLCASCHGPAGVSADATAFASGRRPGNMNDYRHMDTFTDEDIARKVQVGGFEMPMFAEVRGDELVSLVAFVRELSRPGVRGVALQGLAQGEVRDFAPVTPEMLARPADADWLMFRRTYDNWAYSPLARVTRQNVGTLQLAWSRAMLAGGQYSTPLVYNGTMYLLNPGDVIQALDATNGDLIWEFRWDGPPGEPRRAGPRPRSRSLLNIALAGDKLYHLTADRHLIAINARHGTLAWHTKEEGEGIGHLGGPIVAAGKVLSGRSCDPRAGPESCYIAAHDAETGREVWRAYTMPRPGEPGDQTWGGLPWERRVHVGTWGSPGSYDPALVLTYWGTSVPAPSLEVLRGTAGQDVLFSNSTLALDVNTGRRVWHYQHLPRDNWDLDHVFERMLVDVVVAPDPSAVRWINPAVRPGETRAVVTGIPGKTGLVYTLDRKTGEFLWASETINQNVIADIDPRTGRVAINEALIAKPFQELTVCPSLGGGKDWPAGAYSPRTGLMYQPQQNMCMLLTGNTATPTPADGYATSWVMIPDPKASDPTRIGRVDAVSLSTGRPAWRHERRAGVIGSLVATGGDLVFGGDVNRRFFAFDARTGDVVWETPVSGPVSGHAISYEVAGRQYIAIPVGGDTASPERRVLSLHPEIKPPQGSNAIFVFALPVVPAPPTGGATPWVPLVAGGLGACVLGGLIGAYLTRRRTG